ncbi:stathmin domain-containing protein 1 [Trichomycterus rosablanca]|uniref:stathmin domain-containing protein 1 n=1 Tax=Trichomycterus rosablanca TaxID=2290929 RepID=UPI002F353490
MGCGISKITAVEPVKPDTKENVPVRDSPRGDSAVSKITTDSGVGLDTGETTLLPGAVPRILPPLRARSPVLTSENQRPDSSVIIEQLLSQGIIPAQSRVGGSGEAYNIMLDDAGRPTRRPPPRLETLKINKEREITRKEDIDERMRQVEERRKVREEGLLNRLRAKSAQPRGIAPVMDEKEEKEVWVHAEVSPSLRLPSIAKEGSSGEEADQKLTHSLVLENFAKIQQKEETVEVI